MQNELTLNPHACAHLGNETMEENFLNGYSMSATNLLPWSLLSLSLPLPLSLLSHLYRPLFLSLLPLNNFVHGPSVRQSDGGFLPGLSCKAQWLETRAESRSQRVWTSAKCEPKGSKAVQTQPGHRSEGWIPSSDRKPCLRLWVTWHTQASLRWTNGSQLSPHWRSDYRGEEEKEREQEFVLRVKLELKHDLC